MVNHHEPGLPIIARLHEVQSAAELAATEGFERARGPAPPVARPPSRQHEAHAPERFRAVPEARCALPFVGEVVSHEPGVAVTIECRLSLDEDLHLADHHFIHALDVKPLSACFPVVPMTMSLEIMAEAAACLAPGYGLTGFERVSAARWIAMADTDTLTLRVTGRLRDVDAVREIRRIDVEIVAQGEPRPSITATVLFSSHYQLDLDLRFGAVTSSRARTLSAACLYEARELFHGPRFQSLVGDLLVGERGAQAELLVRAPVDLFRSTAQPQLLSDPALLDAVGQVMAIWTQQQGDVAFPIGLGKLELYQATPAPGTRVPMRLEVTGEIGKTPTANVEIQDGQGGVWLRIQDWRSWRFRWDRRLVAFRQWPARHLLSDALALPTSAAQADTVCQRMTKARLAGFDADLLARDYLHVAEMPAYASKTGGGQPMQWLLGRIAAKDALRAWALRQEGGGEMLHPAAFAITNDSCGKPGVTHWPYATIPEVSLAHSGEEAVAIAQRAPVGIDLERIAPRGADFVKAIASASERALLETLAAEPSDEWVTRLWCAKEAFGKLFGTGVDSTPHRFEAAAIEASGHLHMRHRDSGREAQVVTLRDGGFVVAVAKGHKAQTH
ncbi:4'-phosphopantetheinyl transferase superfamily protein [Paraburkholderia sp. JHI2823]|uniref:4'-phosphopantetheinyl transferase superfamily protein n=1 Tax=Paraburkholderia TaxID=1822464 RepID=UPI00040F4E7C|nr:4'-phosphopantetheinyl transferase superfamily protein [Paraburkholderia mimosarum]